MDRHVTRLGLLAAGALWMGCGSRAEPPREGKQTEATTPKVEPKSPDAKAPDAKAPDAEIPTSTAKAPTPDGLTPVPLPPWVGFPADAKALQAAIDVRDPAPLREHAWRLFAGINQPISAGDPRPLWWTWSTTTQLFEQPPSARPTAMSSHRHAARTIAQATPPPAGTPDPDQDHTDECFDAKGNGVMFFPGPAYVLPKATLERFGGSGIDPRCSDPTFFVEASTQSPNPCNVLDGTHFQSNGDIMVATESYDEPGADRIVQRGYDDPATLQALLDAKTPILPDLSPLQVNTKHMYWPVKATGLSALPVFRELPKAQWCQYNGYEQWDALVAVDPTGAVKGQGEVDFLFGVYDHAGTAVLPTKHATVDVHPLDEFYWQKPDWNALDERDRLMLDAASQWAHGKPFEPGDYVVSVAMHIVTKEVPQWTLQSAWWSDRPDEGPYAANRPTLPEARGPWQHYLVTIEYGITSEPGGAVLPVAFNPFIELAATHPVATNCRNCHLRAAWPTASYLTSTGPGPLANIGTGDAIFAGVLLTDFQWVIADRVKPSGSGG